MASPYQLFQRAERVERLCARVYVALAGRFRHDPEACAVFLRLGAEEEQHANRVRLFAAHYRNDPKVPVTADLGELDACAAECEQAIAEIEAGSWGTDLAEVNRRVYELEVHMARAHADLLARNASPNVREFLAALAAQDEAHVALLSGTAMASQVVLQTGNESEGDALGASGEEVGFPDAAAGTGRGRRPQ